MCCALWRVLFYECCVLVDVGCLLLVGSSVLLLCVDKCSTCVVCTVM